MSASPNTIDDNPHKSAAASLLTPQPVITLNNLPAVNEYQDATPIVAAPAKKGGLSKTLVISSVVLVVLLIVVIVIFAPFGRTPKPPISSPVSTNGSSKPPIKPDQIQKDKVTYAAVAADDTLRIYDVAGKQLTISLDTRKWRDIQFSPDGKYVSVLSSIGTKQNDYNLEIYSIADEKWTKVTVFDETTTGITSYTWSADNEVLFFQDGWLHKFSLQSSEIIKLVDLDAELIWHDSVKKNLIVREIKEYTIKEAVIEKQPDPNFQPKDKAPLIDVVKQPAIIKRDPIYKVVDYTGNLVRGFKVGDFETNTGLYVLDNVYFAKEVGQYLATTFVFDPASGNTSLPFNYKSYRAYPQIAEVTSLGASLSYRVMANVIGNSFIVAKLNQNQTLAGFAIWDYGNDTFVKELPTKLPADELLVDYKVHGEGNAKNILLSISTSKSVNGKIEKLTRWYNIDTVRGELQEIEFGKNFMDIAFRLVSNT